MKHTLVRFGLVSAAILIGANLLWLLVMGIPGPEDFRVGEIIGYSIIVVALIPVFFGIRHQRDRMGDGAISFWKASGTGLGITVFPSLAFALYNILYIKVIDPDFQQKYMQYALDSARERMTEAELQAFEITLQSQHAIFANPVPQFVLMFLTVFAIGVVVALVSALGLRRRAARPA